MNATGTTTRAAEAAAGGAIIGVAVGTYMLIAGKVAGNSGAVKAIIYAISDPKKRKAEHVSNILFFFGLILAGLATSFATPWGFEPYPSLSEEWGSYVFGGLLIGSGTFFGNGCTSGHGLCGISKLSLRSVVATPVFMVAASLTAFIKSSFAVGAIAPFVQTTSENMESTGWVVLVLLVLGSPMFFLARSPKKFKKYLLLFAGLWCGLTFGAGLTIGGMVRPSAVTGALSAARFDFTLWILFTTALVVSFLSYRVAEMYRIHGEEARCKKQGPLDKKLIGGALLFGVGWGLTGLCPGPLLVGIAADLNTFTSGQRVTGGPLVTLVCVFVGQALAKYADDRIKISCAGAVVDANNAKIVGDIATVTNPAAPPTTTTNAIAIATTNASLVELNNAVEYGAMVIDVRNSDDRECNKETGTMLVFENTLSVLLDRSDPTAPELPSKCLPSDKSTPVIIHCKSGGRARVAANTAIMKEYTSVLCCGLHEMEELSKGEIGSKFVRHEINVTKSKTGIFMQLFDPVSSTFTYLIGDKESGEAILIDPVLERLDDDIAALKILSLTPCLGINTHCHADHITSTGKMKELVPTMQSVISAASKADADIKLVDGQEIVWGNGTRKLVALSTPGHTSGCMSFYDEEMGVVFTGDTLLIDGCGRTDFQGGSSQQLWRSVHDKLFTLPAGTLIGPAHDYKGRVRSTIGHEQKYNSRLTKPIDEFVEIMENLGLNMPKKIDVAVPANLRCGV